ncbi:MAG: 16S rRNA (guanine(966)-N(2))-methyltransferase RsmD [Ruminococcus sp.]|nr:16S rRNA (guanine(966)-N(2))-methyltransferase RsmD [Ruminococcus sp.]MBQ7133903.1 16S rRNA (guanine(966)-N(2))-methyltransferase RsmD [Ruminococcus sp.]
MRVITGKARGRILETLKGDDVRPTTDKVKEAIFSSIQFELEGRHFLDLFSGCGQMGIEALSRGCSTATFIDRSKAAIKVIERNLSVTNLKQFARVYNADSLSFAKTMGEEYDIVFLDPPYNKGILQEIMPIVAQRMKKTGVIICESALNDEILQKYYKFTLDRQRTYGKIKVSIYRHEDYI